MLFDFVTQHLRKENSLRTNIAQCRCGHSQHKPFCDGSHQSEGFRSEIKARKI
ncbi:MAG: CDGSH iron-sulfur domain-containing protein [Acidobacteriota bacterium]